MMKMNITEVKERKDSLLNRIFTIDFVRGLAVVLMALDQLQHSFVLLIWKIFLYGELFFTELDRIRFDNFDDNWKILSKSHQLIISLK